MNGYDLSRAWFNFRYGKKNEVKSSHSELYFYIVELWNRLGQPDKFGLPTDASINALGIGSYNTYKKALDGLIEWGFVIEVESSKNQHQSRVIALSKIAKSLDKALDKALIKATDETLDKTVDSITKQRTTNNESKSHYGGEPPKPKKEILYWKVIVDYWFEFYKSKFQAEPTFNATAGKSLKSILTRFERLSKKKKYEWTEDRAMRTFKKFLESAWEDNWMRENFLLTNLSSKFDSIINKNPVENGKPKQKEKGANSDFHRNR